ncbi:MAG: electron transfer flavoprotein subunit beta/FixA family protein [Alphaproteobacteria bacterium]|nr:electron transfer flavoprotein subunit beta/FixA family protein [Alphaproteobacteria bacterium]MCL2505445.1 electron transfer flavoprotein subunit beta/FixA family protein [Alphaproteobacteria bacterium]
MKILVPVKRVIDYNVNIRVKPDNSAVETANVKMSMNPFDEIAVEEAVRLKEANIASEIIAVSIGPAGAVETLRTALAMGTQRAIHVPCEINLQSFIVADILSKIVEKEKPELVIMGKQGIDQEGAQAGAELAAMLGWSQGLFVSKLQVESGKITVSREIDGGLETLSLKPPSVITVDLRLNTPRFATLPNIMKAKKIAIETIETAALGVSLESSIETLKVFPPHTRKAGIMVKDVAELVDKLRNEAKVI